MALNMKLEAPLKFYVTEALITKKFFLTHLSLFPDAASGVSVDHAYGEHKIPIGYVYEMRGSGNYGNYGFFLPPQFIIPNGEEVVASLVGLVQRARDFGYLA
jgi:Zinc carboxypeptidase